MQEENATLRTIAKGAGIFLIGLFASKILAYAYRIIIARTGSAEQYGLLSIGLAVFGFLVTISILGMNESVIRFVAFYKGKSDYGRAKGVIISALKITLPVSIICALLLFLFSDWVAVKFFHNSDLGILLKIIAFGLPFDVLRSIFFSSIRAFQKITYEVYGKSVAENVAKVALTFVAVYLGLGIVGAMVAYLISIFVSFALSVYFMEKKVFSVFKNKVMAIGCNKTLLSYSIPVMFTGFIYLIMQWTDTLMLGYFRTASEVGIYNVALPTAALLYVFPSALRTLFFPALSEIYAQNKADVFKSVYQIVTKWIFVVDSIVLILLIAFSKQIISFLFGEVYTTDQVSFFGLTFTVSALALVILSFSALSAEFLSPAKDVLLVLKKTKFVFFSTVLGSILNVILNFILIPKHGMIGAAIATSFAYSLIFILIGVWAYIITKINPFKKSCLKVLLSSGCIILLIIILKLYSITSILLTITIGLILLIVYFSILYFIGFFEEEDIMIINAIKQKLRLKFNNF